MNLLSQNFPSARELSKVPAGYAIEIEFLVAQKRPDRAYYYERRWACEADLPEATVAPHVVIKVAALLGAQSEPVHALWDGEKEGADRYAQISEWNTELCYTRDRANRYGYWCVDRAENAAALIESPFQYDWVGIKLRSPLLNFSSLVGESSRINVCLDWLREDIVMHVNSTCQLRVIVAPTLEHGSDAPLNLNAMKKFATAVWLLEKKMIMPLASDCGTNMAITDHSCVALRPVFSRSEAAAPEEPSSLEAMENATPVFKDRKLRQSIYTIWGAKTLTELVFMLRAPDQRKLGLAYYEYHFDETPQVSLSYSFWQPHRTIQNNAIVDLDDMNNWVRLTVALFRLTQINTGKFRALVTLLERIPDRPFDVNNRGEFEAIDRGEFDIIRDIMSLLTLDEDTIQGWPQIAKQYKRGGALDAATRVNTFGILPALSNGIDF